MVGWPPRCVCFVSGGPCCGVSFGGGAVCVLVLCGVGRPVLFLPAPPPSPAVLRCVLLGCCPPFGPAVLVRVPVLCALSLQLGVLRAGVPFVPPLPALSPWWSEPHGLGVGWGACKQSLSERPASPSWCSPQWGRRPSSAQPSCWLDRVALRRHWSRSSVADRLCGGALPLGTARLPLLALPPMGAPSLLGPALLLA